MSDRTLPQPSEFEVLSAAIDSLSEAVKASGGEYESVRHLWAGMFGLERWLFIARGEAQNPTPFIGVIDGIPSLCVFTSPQRAQAFARAAGLTEQEAGLVLGIPTDHVAAWCETFASNGVQRIIVDPGDSGFFLPLGQLTAVEANLVGNPPA